MPRTLFERYWQEKQVHSLALKLRDPELANTGVEAFRERFGRQGQFAVYDNAALRRRVFDIFDETFAVTSILARSPSLWLLPGCSFHSARS